MLLYDETRWKELIAAWAQAKCDDFGEEQAQALYASFSQWIIETRAMRRLPGRTLFGMALRACGYEKRVMRGLTYWSGLALKRRDGEV